MITNLKFHEQRVAQEKCQCQNANFISKVTSHNHYRYPNLFPHLQATSQKSLRTETMSTQHTLIKYLSYQQNQPQIM